MKDKSQDARHGRQKCITLFCGLAVIALCCICYAPASEPAALESTQAGPAEPNVLKTPVNNQKQQEGTLEQVYGLICSGDFENAGELIEDAEDRYDANLHSLLKIVYEYKAISQRREAARRSAYQEKLADLQKTKVAADANDINDVNEITKALSVIATAGNFAEQQQKEALLADPFVLSIFEKALDKADEFEAEGKWLEAYMGCYSWLQAIMPDNDEYSDHADDLIEKANIAASLQDSPCETRQERYENVQGKMFKRAVDALHFNYVDIIHYQDMAVKAINRCRMLAQVMSSLQEEQQGVAATDNSSDGLSKGETGPSANQTDQDSYTAETGRFEAPRLAAWSAALSALLDEVNRSPTGISKDKFINIFDKVLALNSTTVELPRTVLIAQFAEAALSVLDPYTVVVWPQQVKNFEKTMTNEFSGIGIEISRRKGLLTVASLLPGTPAYYSGLDAGDVIEDVDNVPTKDMSLGCAVRRITGPAGTQVMLTIRRQGEDKTKDIAITRARITVPTIRGWKRTEAGKWLYMIDDVDKVGYVRITSFSAGTADGLEKVLCELEQQNLAALILDLRFNSGGLLDAAVAVTDKFVDEGLIVKTQPRFIPTYATARKEGTHPNYPLVVLINRYSASASEIVAGALQDQTYKRASLVGERTHGKGSVQGITPYPGEGAQLKYTMAYYHLPSGQRVKSRDEVKKQGREDWGVGPDVQLELRSDELKTMLDMQRQNDVLVRADHHNGSMPLSKHTLDQTLEADPQLAVGLLVVKSKLIQQQTQKLQQEAAVLSAQQPMLSQP